MAVPCDRELDPRAGAVPSASRLWCQTRCSTPRGVVFESPKRDRRPSRIDGLRDRELQEAEPADPASPGESHGSVEELDDNISEPPGVCPPFVFCGRSTGEARSGDSPARVSAEEETVGQCLAAELGWSTAGSLKPRNLAVPAPVRSLRIAPLKWRIESSVEEPDSTTGTFTKKAKADTDTVCHPTVPLCLSEPSSSTDAGCDPIMPQHLAEASSATDVCYNPTIPQCLSARHPETEVLDRAHDAETPPQSLLDNVTFPSMELEQSYAVQGFDLLGGYQIAPTTLCHRGHDAFDNAMERALAQHGRKDPTTAS